MEPLGDRSLRESFQSRVLLIPADRTPTLLPHVQSFRCKISRLFSRPNPVFSPATGSVVSVCRAAASDARFHGVRLLSLVVALYATATAGASYA